MLAPISISSLVIDRSLFAEQPDTPVSVFFGDGASVIKLYPYLKYRKLYTMIDYWMNPDGDIYFRLLEFEHYIKFVEGGMYIGKFIKIN